MVAKAKGAQRPATRRKTPGSVQRRRSTGMRIYQKPVEQLAQMAAPYNPRRISDHDPIVLDFEFTRTSHQDGQVSVASPLPS